MITKAKIAEPYAEALFGIAQDTSSMGEPFPIRVLKALQEFEKVLENPELTLVFTSPLISRKERRNVLDQLLKRLPFETAVLSLVGRFLKVLCDHDRFSVYREVVELFSNLWKSYQGLSVAVVTVAKPLSDSQRRELKSNLKQTVGRDCILEEHVDPDLLGGLRVEVDGRLYDMSVRGQLEQMRLRLKNAFPADEISK